MELQRMGEFYCDVCFELFGEGIRCPRILACGHSYCYSCLENLLVQSPSCPNCKQGIQFTSVDGIPVNYIVKSIVSRLKIPESHNGPISQLNSDLTREQKKDSGDSFPLMKDISSKELPYEGYCEDHHVNKHFRCMECNCWVCGDCATLNHKSCRTILVAEALDEMKQEIRQEFKAEIEVQKLQSKNLDKVLIDLNKKRLSIKNEIKILHFDLRKKMETLKSIDKNKENILSLKSERQKHCEKLRLMKNFVEKTSNGDQFMKAKIKWNEFLTEAMKLIEKQTIPRYSRCHFSLELLRDWCQDESVYASHCQNGSTQYGKVVVKRERVWVHCFKSLKPLPRNVIISFRDLLINFSGTFQLPRRGFLQIEGDASVLNDVVIATDALTPRAMNFLLLCSGIKGRSYEGLLLLSVEWCIATYPNESGAVVRGIRDGGVFEAPVKKGFVWSGEAEDTDSLSIFFISVRDNPSVKLDTKFGFVEEGIDVCERINDNKIMHCGLVI